MPLKPRVLVFIVAYQAETTISKVVQRIPASLADSYDVDILIIDDSSGTRPLSAAIRSAKAMARLSMFTSYSILSIRATAETRSSVITMRSSAATIL